MCSRPGEERPFRSRAYTSPPHSRTSEGASASPEAGILALLLLLSYRWVPWRGGNPPRVAKVCHCTWRRTPEGPLRAREVTALEPVRLLSLPNGSEESPPLAAFSCCPPAALGGDSEISTGMSRQLPPFGKGGEGTESTRNGKDSLLCSCRPTKPLLHSF